MIGQQALVLLAPPCNRLGGSKTKDASLLGVPVSPLHQQAHPITKQASKLFSTAACLAQQEVHASPITAMCLQQCSGGTL